MSEGSHYYIQISPFDWTEPTDDKVLDTLITAFYMTHHQTKDYQRRPSGDWVVQCDSHKDCLRAWRNATSNTDLLDTQRSLKLSQHIRCQCNLLTYHRVSILTGAYDEVEVLQEAS